MILLAGNFAIPALVCGIKYKKWYIFTDHFITTLQVGFFSAFDAEFLVGRDFISDLIPKNLDV